MLPKSERLKNRSLFNLAFKKKLRFSTDILSLYYLFNKKDINKLQKNHFIKTAFVAGLKVDKSSVKRNLIKRRMKAAYKIVLKNLKNKANYFIFIWIANPPIKNSTFEQIKTTMDKLIKRLDNLPVKS